MRFFTGGNFQPPPGYFPGPPPPHGYPAHGYHGGYPHHGYGGYPANWEDYGQTSAESNNWNPDNKERPREEQEDTRASLESKEEAVAEEAVVGDKPEENLIEGRGREKTERDNENKTLKCEDKDTIDSKTEEVLAPIKENQETTEMSEGESKTEMKSVDEKEKPVKEESTENKSTGDDSASNEYDFDKSLAEDQMISPTGSRRKQTTPTKKPESTVLITHGGQPPPASPTRPRKGRKGSDETQKQKDSNQDSTQPAVKKKRGRPFKVKPSESSDSPQKPKTPKKSLNSSFAAPKSSPTIQRLEEEEAPQRRRSKGEMKEFPLGDLIPEASEPVTKATKDKAEIFDKTENDVKGPGTSDSTDLSKDENKIENPSKPESVKKKRGRKSKSETNVDSPSPAPAGGDKKEAKAPGRERSKRQSAQTASLKLHETSDDEEFYFTKNESKSKSDQKEDKSEEPVTSSDKTVDNDKLEVVLETSVERPRKQVRKEMIESLVGNEKNRENTESPQAELDKEQEEKRDELIKSMMKSIESTGAKRGRKRKSKTNQTESTEAENETT